MKAIFAILSVLTLSSSAFALTPKRIQLVRDGEAWLISATTMSNPSEVIPANEEVADALNALNKNKSHDCEAKGYQSSPYSGAAEARLSQTILFSLKCSN